MRVQASSVSLEELIMTDIILLAIRIFNRDSTIASKIRDLQDIEIFHRVYENFERNYIISYIQNTA